jgi:tripartite-type tricarboxylate transporter receptor subunit TctC
MTGARTLPALMLAACCGLAAVVPASAQSYPTRTIKIIVPFPPGGPTDVLARLLAEKMSPLLGQNIIVESRPGGAGGTVGAKAVSASEPDGYTVLLSQAGALTISPSINKSLDFEPLKMLTPVALAAISPQILAVTPSLPVKSFAELIAYGKANPGKLYFGSAGVGSQPHLLGELSKIDGNFSMTHVPYRGSAPAIIDLLAGQIQVIYDTPVVLLPHIEAGKLRALAVTTETRMPQLPDVPTMKELGYPRLSTYLWTGLLAPPHTPPLIADKINATLNEAETSADMRANLAKLGAEPKAMTRTEFTEFMTAETKKWAEVVAKAGIKSQ